MDKKINITPNRIIRLWKKMGNRNLLAARLEVTEIAIRNWETESRNISAPNRRELERLMEEYGIN